MSKTETQSKAESLAKMLEYGAFSPNLLQNEIGVRKGAADELRRLDAENKALREFAELAQAIVKFNREHGSILAVHIDNLADLVDERAAQAAAKTGDAA